MALLFRSRMLSAPCRHSFAVFSANFVAFLFASAGAFQPQNNMLLISMDGEFTRNATMLMARFAGLPIGLPGAPFEGLNCLFSFNPLLSPSLLPLALLKEGWGLWLSFLICAALLFTSTYVLGRALGFGRGVSVLAAWAVPLLSLPYQSWINLYLTFNLNPLAGDTVSAAMLGVACVARGYSNSRVYGAALGLAGIVLWLFLANPLWIILTLPGVIPISVGLIASHIRERDGLYRTAWLVLPSALFVVLGGAPYLIGLFTDTAVAFFPQELNANLPKWVRLITVAMAGGSGLDPIGASWIGLALIGIVLAIRRGGFELRIAAYSIIVALVFFTGYGVAYLIVPGWVAPYPVYYEFCLWPYYGLFAAYAVGCAAARIASLGNKYASRISASLRGVFSPRWRYEFLLPFIGVVLGIFMARHPFVVASDLYRRPIDTVASRTLTPEIGISPGATFRGYVANLTGFGGPNGAPTDWLRVQYEANDAFLAFGNTDRMPYLWRYDLPTIEAYSQLNEPALYALVTRLLDRRGDGQIRNIIMVTRVNIPLMQSLGVRYLITDFQPPAPARLVAQQSAASVSHFVYELPNPNIGNYSPVEILSAANATVAMRDMADPGFDFRKSVVMNEPQQEILVPALRSRVSLVHGGWRIEAETSGTSLLLLPVQFSRCLSVSASQATSAGKVVALRPANLASTAIVFQGTIDVELSLLVSPLLRPYCRIEDLREMRAFGVADVPRVIEAAVPGSDSAAGTGATDRVQ